MDIVANNNELVAHFVTEEHIKHLVTECGFGNTDDFSVENFCVYQASDKMLGFLADYWKIKVVLVSTDGERRDLPFFVKALSRSNKAKAEMVREMNLLQKEINFYSILKNKIEVPGIPPWSPRFVGVFDEAMVFEDLNAKNYKNRDKFLRFDMNHAYLSLKTLAGFHASSIIFEDKQSKLLLRKYNMFEDLEQYLDRGGYTETSPWYNQCMIGALQAIKRFSKYNNDEKVLKVIETQWRNVWLLALQMNNFVPEQCNVICHRDLWNNNILFKYPNAMEGNITPDDCVFVDFAAVRYQPAVSDVMLLLYCNLEPKFREENMESLLNFYYEELKMFVEKQGVFLDSIMPKDLFLKSAFEYRLHGLIFCACLLPQFWIDDDLMTKTFTDTDKFLNILSVDKGSFILTLMEENSDYRQQVIEIFEEIVDLHCLNKENDKKKTVQT